MKKFLLRAPLALATVLAFVYAAAPLPIGTANAHGSMRVDGSRITGNATVFEGTVIETDIVTTDLRLQKGVEMRLAAGSRGQFYSDRAVLERGSTEIATSGNFSLEASRLKITPADTSSRGTVSLRSGDRIEVAAFHGGLNVRTSDGILLAKVVPGRFLLFEPQAAGAAAPTTIEGTLSEENGHFVVTVAATGVKYEVTGKDFRKAVGKKVVVVGTLAPSGAAAAGTAGVLVVSNLTIAGAAAAGAATATGMALGTKLVIAGVAVAAATGTAVGVKVATGSDTPASR